MHALSGASLRIGALEAKARELFEAGLCIFFLPEVANDVDLGVWDQTLSPFEKEVSSLFSEYHFLQAPTSRGQKKKRAKMLAPNMVNRADTLKERLTKVREQVWKHVKDSWSAGAKIQLELIIGCAHDAMGNEGLVRYSIEADSDSDEVDKWSLIRIADLRLGNCIETILDHFVWAIAGDAFALTQEVRKAVESFGHIAEKAYTVFECAIVSNVDALRRLHGDLQWNPTQINALYKSQVAEFGHLSDGAQKEMRFLIDSLRPLARVALETWHASVRVLLGEYGLHGPGALAARQIAAVIGKTPATTKEESPELHSFVNMLLQVP